jgi:FAD/FMN-containing dehydrogenase
VEDIREELAGIVGPDNVRVDAAGLSAYTQDESFVAPMAPQAVVRPGTSDEVQHVVAWANRTLTPLVPVSSGPPHFHGDTVPSVPNAVIVDLSRLNTILRIDRRNRMAVIEPGVTYAELQPALAEQGMRVTPPLAPRITKSVVASLLERQPTLIPRYNYHLPEPLRSCGVIWGSGQVMFTGEAGAGPLSLEDQWAAGLVQAEPKGPGQTDFYRLLTGAQGSMGIVTWAAVKCELLPAAHKLLFAAADSLDELIPFAYRLNRVRLGDEMLIVNGSYLARLLAAGDAGPAAVGALRAALPPWTLILGLGGREHYPDERVAVAEEDARTLAADCGRSLRSDLPGAAGGRLEQVVGGVRGAPWQLAYKGASAEIFFLATLDKAPGYLESVRATASAHSYPADDLGVYLQPQHQGVSHHIECSLPYDATDAAESDRAREVFVRASERLIAEGAYFSRPYGCWAGPVYDRDAASTAALRKVKAIFDPNNVLNPGKLCFTAARKEA